MAVQQSNKENIINILKHYVPSSDKDKINYDIIAEKILQKAGLNAYSNTQIKNISIYRPIKGQHSETTPQAKMLEIIERTDPEIKKEDIARIIDLEKTWRNHG